MTTLAPDALLDASRDYGVRLASGLTGVDDGWNAAVLGGVRRGEASAMVGYVHREGSEPDTAADVEPNPRDYCSDSVLAKVEFGAMPGGPLLVVRAGERTAGHVGGAWLGLAGSRFVNTTVLEGDDEPAALSRERQPAPRIRPAHSIRRMARLPAGHRHAQDL